MHNFYGQSRQKLQAKLLFGRHKARLAGAPMRRREFLAGVGACAASAAAIVPARAGQITLRLATWGAPTAPQVTEFVSTFQKSVEKGSNGQISVQHFPAGSLVNESRPLVRPLWTSSASPGSAIGGRPA